MLREEKEERVVEARLGRATVSSRWAASGQVLASYARRERRREDIKVLFLCFLNEKREKKNATGRDEGCCFASTSLTGREEAGRGARLGG